MRNLSDVDRDPAVDGADSPGSVPAGPGRPRLAHVRRYTEIASVLVKYGFVDAVDALHLRPYLAAGRRALSAFGHDGHPEPSRAVRLRLTCEELGTTFIKLGQALSLRADLLPADVVAELTRLQDDVPPLPAGGAEAAITASLGRPLTGMFERFDPQPLAAASIAQVHHAVLATGEHVAVKVRRPGIETAIEADLEILAELAALAERYVPDARLYSPRGLVAEFARTIRRELDLVREGRLIARVASQFAGDPTVRFPAIVWPLTTPGVLTMEFLDGVKVSAVGTADAPGLDPHLVAERGANAVLRQVLVNGLFHADPHPGNILVLPGSVVAFVDFGIVGRLDREMRNRLAEVILAIHRHDAERLAEIVVSVATPLRPVDLAALARDLDEMLDVHADLSLGELAIGPLFASITATMSQHRLRLPADLLLLIKAVTTIEAVGRQLDPGFRMVDHAAPFVEALVAGEHSPSALAMRTAEAGRDVLLALRRLPADLSGLTRSIRADGITVRLVHRDLGALSGTFDRAAARLSLAVVTAAVVIGASIVLHSSAGPALLGYPALGLAGLAAAAILGLGLAIGSLRSRRRQRGPGAE